MIDYLNVVSIPSNCKFNSLGGVYYGHGSTRIKGKSNPVPNQRTCIGKKIDDKTMYPNNSYYMLFPSLKPNFLKLDLNIPHPHLSVGEYFVVDKIAKTLGLDVICNGVFDNDSSFILTLAQYFLTSSVINGIDIWWSKTASFLNKNITSQNTSRFFSGVSQEQIDSFLKAWISSNGEEFGVAIDSTSISSYSNNTTIFEIGHSKEQNHLEQLNLMVAFGQKLQIPMCYQIIKGSITDEISFKKSKKYFQELGLNITRWTMDNGFYSQENTQLFSQNEYFVCPLSENENHFKEMVEKYCESIEKSQNIIDTFVFKNSTRDVLYGIEKEILICDRPHKLHLYYSLERRMLEVSVKLLKIAHEEMMIQNFQGRIKPITATIKKYLKLLENHFDIEIAEEQIIKFDKKHDVIDSEMKKYGFFCLITNDTSLTSKQVIEWYSKREGVEECFNNFKNRLDFRRLHTHSDITGSSKIFVGFISLIIKSYLDIKFKNYKQEYIESTPTAKKTMSNFANYSALNLIEEVGNIIVTATDDKKWINLNPINKKSKQIFKMIGSNEEELKDFIEKLDASRTSPDTECDV